MAKAKNEEVETVGVATEAVKKVYSKNLIILKL